MNKIIVLISILLNGILYSYTFSPPTVTLSPSGINSSFIYTLKNESENVVPIDISVNEFSKDIDGNHIQGEVVYDDFIIYPAQFILDAGEKRSVQIRWAGEPSFDIEKSYTVLCKEVLLPENERKNNNKVAIVKVKKNYEGRLYIESENSAPKIALKEINSPVNSDGEQELEIIVENSGNKHGDLSSYCFEISYVSDDDPEKGSKKITLTSKDIPKMISSILAKSTRRYKILWPEEIPFGNISVELKER
ncbi:MAG: fimbria/pilus periplasmic chaperone [Candidatus Delongbacteria bacterium]|nr:fimbria/pilus periplasmic chaperone [Candidatus Delongbacteria bacterium]